MAAVTDHTVKVVEEVVADKGYHSRTTVHDLEMLEIRTYISEPDRGPQSWTDQHTNATPCMRIAVASEALAENASFEDAVNCSNAPALISMKPVGGGVLTCAATRTC